MKGLQFFGNRVEDAANAFIDVLKYSDQSVDYPDFKDIEPSVRDMIEKLKLYYGVDIVVNNTRILKNRYTGKFRTKDGVEHVLKVLKLNNKFTYTKDDETNVITIN